MKAVRSGQEIVDYVLEMVGSMSRRPLMFGASPHGVNTLFWYYFHLLSVAHGRHREFEEVKYKQLEIEECGAMDFATKYRELCPGSSDQEAAAYVVKQWLTIFDRAGLAIPWQLVDEEGDGFVHRWYSVPAEPSQ